MLKLFQRRRLWAVTCAGLLVLALAALWLLHKPYAGRTYRIGVRNNSQYSIVAPDGHLSGIAVDVVSAAARRAGIHLQWIPSPEGPDEALGSKRVDLWPALTMLSERKSRLHISDAWLSGDSYVISKGGPRVSDWRGARVAYALAPVSLVTASLPHSIPVEKPDEDAALRAVCSGEADGAIVWVHSVGSLLLQRPQGCEAAVLRVTTIRTTRFKMGVGSTFESAGAADELRTQIGHLAAEGALTGFFENYSGYSTAETENIY